MQHHYSHSEFLFKSLHAAQLLNKQTTIILFFLFSSSLFVPRSAILVLIIHYFIGIIPIRFDGCQQPAKFHYLSFFGRPIYNNILDNSTGTSAHNIDISSNNDGIYILQLVQGDKKSMFKIIKE